jgi:hypothetical protein
MKSATTAPRAYDPDNLSPGDAEDRLNDPDDGIDYDEIIASTQDDFLAGRFSFNGAEYATREEERVAFAKYMQDIYDEWKRDHDARHGSGNAAHHAASETGPPRAA